VVMNMSEYDKLFKEFEKKITKLRDNCPHNRVTGWMNYYWAPGHLASSQIKICKRCGQIVEIGEGKLIVEDDEN